MFAGSNKKKKKSKIKSVIIPVTEKNVLPYKTALWRFDFDPAFMIFENYTSV